MPTSSTSVRRDWRTGERSELPDARTARYGGLVGDMLDGIEQRIAESPVPHLAVPARIDAAHRVSVVSGYVGLALGFGVAGVLLGWVF